MRSSLIYKPVDVNSAERLPQTTDSIRTDPSTRPRSVVELHNDPLARQQVENAPKDQRYQRATEDDDIVWHGEIRRRKINEERRGVHALRDAPSTR
jgi:hypothetical protein